MYLCICVYGIYISTMYKVIVKEDNKLKIKITDIKNRI